MYDNRPVGMKMCADRGVVGPGRRTGRFLRRSRALRGTGTAAGAHLWPVFGTGIRLREGFRDVRGFTLLEVALVVILMAVVLAVTYPSLSRGSSALRLRTTGRDVVNAMRTAREKAVTEQKEMRVVADREAQKILMTDELGDGARVYALPHGIRMARMFLAGHEVVDGPMVIRFLSNGSCENAEIILVSDKGSALRVSADPITGAARIVPVSGAEQQ